MNIFSIRDSQSEILNPTGAKFAKGKCHAPAASWNSGGVSLSVSKTYLSRLNYNYSGSMRDQSAKVMHTGSPADVEQKADPACLSDRFRNANCYKHEWM